MLFAGIDAGSRTIKIVLWDSVRQVVSARGLADQGVQQEMLVMNLLDRLLAEIGHARPDLNRTVATGYARGSIRFAQETITEITCHARGVRAVHPQVRTVVEIGGQDSKLIRLDTDGTVRDFAMNDRCAAGTGCYLEMLARRLDVPLDDLGRLAGSSRTPALISSTCAVFAETEIIGLLASGTPVADIVAGAMASIASRLAGMAGSRVEAPVVFTGGVARIAGMDQALTVVLGQPVQIASDPQYTGALGAALLAAR
jgi:predicted CoA-substrate-specific enzyme activase